MIKLELKERFKVKDILNGTIVEKIEKLVKLGIELTIDKNYPKLKGNSEFTVQDGVWKILYKPTETTNLYLFSKELIIGKDEKCYFEMNLEDNWDLEEIRDDLQNIVSLFNSRILFD